METDEEQVDVVALALLHATLHHYGDPIPEKPDLSLTRILARAAIDAINKQKEMTMQGANINDYPDEKDMLDLRPLPARLGDMSRCYTEQDPELAALLMEARAHVKHAKIHIAELRDKLYGEEA